MMQGNVYYKMYYLMEHNHIGYLASLTLPTEIWRYVWMSSKIFFRLLDGDIYFGFYVALTALAIQVRVLKAWYRVVYF